MATDWRDITDEREKYAAYLCSREWCEKREAVRTRSGGKCERCRVGTMYAVHHLTYARKYDEHPDDLQAVCNPCHEFIHAKAGDDPAGLVAFFDPETVLQIVRSLRMSAARSTTERGRDCLQKWARACCEGVCGADGRIGIKGTLGFLRTIALRAGRAELARVEMELHRGI